MSDAPAADRYAAALGECAAAEAALAAEIAASGRSRHAALRETAAGRRCSAAKLAIYDLTRPLVRGDGFDPEAAIAFVAVPVACQGLCWTRWRLLHRLKQAPLTAAQERRLRELALRLCASREAGYCLQAFGALRRLMIRLADAELIWALAAQADHHDRQTRGRAQALLGGVLPHRPDLPQVCHRP